MSALVWRRAAPIVPLDLAIVAGYFGDDEPDATAARPTSSTTTSVAAPPAEPPVAVSSLAETFADTSRPTHGRPERRIETTVAYPDVEGAKACLRVVHYTAEEQVSWVSSYVTSDRTKTCVYDGPSLEAIHRAAAAGLPVDGIAEVRVLDPYFYTGPLS
jgi:hypothetical protein